MRKTASANIIAVPAEPAETHNYRGDLELRAELTDHTEAFLLSSSVGDRRNANPAQHKNRPHQLNG